MAQKVAVATGNWSTAATWNSVTNTPTIHASTNISAIVGGVFSATFTAPNTTNAATGVLLFIPRQTPGATTLTATLQESAVDTAAAVTITLSNISIIGVGGTTPDGAWVYLRLPTPYVFTTTGAGAYRWKLTVDAGSVNVAANSGGSNFAYLSTDDRTGVPASTDEVFVPGHNATTDITVTVDSSQTIGNGTYTALVNTTNNDRIIGYGTIIGENGILAWDTAADATLTHRGSISVGNGGEWRMGTVASPMPAARLARFRFDWGAATTGQFGVLINAYGRLIHQGTAKSSTSLWKTKYSSGSGTAASPLIVADAVDWSVGDEIIVAATSGSATNYNETERRFIITKNSATSYVVSSTSGGAEAALTFTHTTDAWILNLQRNVLIDSTDTTKGFTLTNRSAVAGNVNADWARYETIAGGAGQAFAAEAVAGSVGSFDYCVYYRTVGTRPGFLTTLSRELDSYTGLIFTQATTTIGGACSIQSNNKTLTDCFFIDNSGPGLHLGGAFNTTVTRGIAVSNGKTNNNYGGITFSSGQGTFNDCEINANRASGIKFFNVSTDIRTGSVGSIFTNLLCGTKGTNSTDIDFTTTEVYSTSVFINSTFGSATFVANYLSAAVGSLAAFQTLNLTANNHIWYTSTGIARSTGAGLADTTTKTVGNLAVRIAPEDSSTGFVWEFLVGIKASSAASIFGFAQKNAAFDGSVCTVELFLPGSTVADATATLTNDTGAWQVFTLAASYTGLTANFATIRITAKTTTANAYVYFTDFYNGTNVLTGIQAWYQGQPTPVMTDLLGDPASVWAILESTQTTVGTMGYEISTDLATLRADVDDLQTRVPATLDGGNMRSSVKAMDNDIITAAVLAASAITEIQSGLAVPGSAMTLTAGERDAIAVAFLDLADAIETGLTPRQAMRLFASALAGVLSGAATNTVTIRNAVANSKARITATVDSDGNRTAVVTDTT